MKPHAFVLKISVLSMVMMLGAVGTAWAERGTDGTPDNKDYVLDQLKKAGFQDFKERNPAQSDFKIAGDKFSNIWPLEGGGRWDDDKLELLNDKTRELKAIAELNGKNPSYYYSPKVKGQGHVYMGGAETFTILPKTVDIRIGDSDSSALYQLGEARPIEFSYEGISFAGKKYVTPEGLNGRDKPIHQVANGKVEKGSTDAVNGGQLWEVKQLIGNGSVDMTPVYRVGALSAAMAGLQPLPFDKDHRFSMSAAVGHYHGQNALAVGMGYYFKRNFRVNAGASVQNARDKMFNLGVAYRFGGSSDAENFIAVNELNHSLGENQRMAQEIVAYQNKTIKLESELVKTKASMTQELKELKKQIDELKDLKKQIQELKQLIQVKK